jgi:hypothetical protein
LVDRDFVGALPFLMRTSSVSIYGQPQGFAFCLLSCSESASFSAAKSLALATGKSLAKTHIRAAVVVLCLGLGLSAFVSCGGVAGRSGPPPPPVIVTPGAANLFVNIAGNAWPPGATQQQFLANQGVTWAVTGGSANGTVDGNGLYSAPAVVPKPATVTVTATSPTASGPAFVTIAAPTALGTAQITVNATASGGPAHGSVVTLTVQ